MTDIRLDVRKNTKPRASSLTSAAKPDAYEQKLWHEIYWDDKDREPRRTPPTRPFLSFDGTPLCFFVPQRRAAEDEQSYRRRCETELLRCIRTVSLGGAGTILDQKPHALNRFAAIFSALRVRAWQPVTLAKFVRRLVILPNFRRAPLRSALSKAFVRLCMANRREIGDVLLDVLCDRRPLAAIVAAVLGEEAFDTVDFSLVQRWATETPYALPFRAYFPPPIADAVQFSRLFATLARQHRLEFNRERLSNQFVNAVLAHASDADFLLLAQLYVRQNRERRLMLMGSRSNAAVNDAFAHLFEVRRPNQFILYGELAAVHKRRYEHLVIVEMLMALAPARLHVYVAVEILSWLSPLLGTTPSAWRRYAAIATNILRAHTCAIKNTPQDKRSKTQ